MGGIETRELVGRDTELAALTTALDLGDQHPRLVVLAGEAGVGKSRLAREVAQAATARGFTVLAGRAVQAASPVPLRPIVEALIGVARTTDMGDLPEVAEYRRALAAIVPDWGQPGEPAAEISPLILGEALLRLLASLGGKGTLLVLEDLQFADPETLAIVEYLADNLAGERVLCLATLRDSEPSDALNAILSLRARRAAIMLDLPRLSSDSVERMAGSWLEGDAPRRFVRRLVADSEGLPYAVEEILASAVSSGELVRTEAAWHYNESVTTGVPTSITESVRRRLAELGQDAADVIAAAAVLGRQFDWTLLPVVAEVGEAEVLAALRRASDAQLIEPVTPRQSVFRFRHSLTRDAVMSDLLPPFLAERSGRAAAAIEAAHPGLPDAWCELAAELHEAAGQRQRAAELLAEAGGRALARGALTSAVATLQRARHVLAPVQPPPVTELAGIDDALVRVLMMTGDCEQLIPVAERLLREMELTKTDLAKKAEIRLRLARALSECDRAEMASRQIAAARELASAAPDPSLAGWADAVAATCAMDAGQPDRALRLARAALSRAEAAMPSTTAADAACEALEVIGRRERLRDTAAASEAFERALQIATAHALPVRRIRALHELGTIEMLEQSQAPRLSQAKRLALEAGAISTVAVLDLQIANARLLGADQDRALRAARRSQHAARRLRLPRVEAMAVATQACVAAIRGDQGYAEELAARAEQIAPRDPSVMITTLGEALVTSAIVINDLPGALAASQAGIARGRGEPLTAPSMAWGYWALLETITGDGGEAAVGEAVSSGARTSFWNRGCLAYAQAVLAGRAGKAGKSRADRLAEQGWQLFEPCAPWWNHLMRWLVSSSALADGWGQPAAWLRDASVGLEEAGYPLVASACRSQLRRAGERVPRPRKPAQNMPDELRSLGLTSRELDVFLLIGLGYSNAEIGSRLSISAKTVETHVTSLIAKAGLGGRRELVAFAARASPAR
jgi:DNA-binding CsgD family transcriptional regulator/tetratricopeptide (TPR) repeat protein